jgi:protein ImuB
MRRREAEAVCPAIVTIVCDPGADAAAFEPVAIAIESVVPRIEISSPGLVHAAVTGAMRYFGGETELVERIVEELEAVGALGYRIGLASGPFAAGIAASQATEDAPIHVVADDAAFVASLDVTALGKEDLAAVFRWLGITTLGALAALPRQAVVSRFGPEGLEAHRLARGEDRATHARVIHPDLAVEERFAPPLENLEQAAFVSRAMAHRLLGELAAQGAAPHRVEVEAEAADGETRVRVWRNVDPFDEETLSERVRWQLRAWLDSEQMRSGRGIRGGLVRLRIAPRDVSDRGRQLALQEDARSAAEAHRALIQTQAIVGVDDLLQARPQGGRHPAERVSWHRWGEPAPSPVREADAPWPGSVPSPAPALVPPEAQTLEVEWDDGMPARVRLGSRWVPVLSWAGPWREVGRWWEGDAASDRYQIVTSAGAFLCTVRDGVTYLTGIYD